MLEKPTVATVPPNFTARLDATGKDGHTFFFHFVQGCFSFPICRAEFDLATTE